MKTKYKFGFVIDPHVSSSTPSGRYDNYFEAIFNKLKAVIAMGKDRNWDAIILTGDVYNVKQMPYPKQNALIQLFRTFPIYTIVGNHDIYYDRLDSLPDTPLGNLIESEAITKLDTAFDGILTGVHYQADVVLPTAPTKGNIPKILVCHAFVGKKPHGVKSKSGGWVTHNQLINSGYDIIVAGHDHTEYPMITLDNGTPVFRFGALSRGSSHEHNLHREPQVLELELSEGNFKYSLITVPHAEAESVFAYTDIALKDSKRDMSHFIDELKSLSTTELSSGGLDDIVKSLDIPAKILRHIHNWGNDFGITISE